VPTGGESSTGLGLYITRQIVKRHGGRIWAESEGKGKGAAFFIELPASSEDVQSKAGVS
jgi:signal transduction histidine kinase